MTLDEIKKELQGSRDETDKLVKCLQDAIQAENEEDFIQALTCADRMAISLSGTIFEALCKIDPEAAMGNLEDID